MLPSDPGLRAIAAYYLFYYGFLGVFSPYWGPYLRAIGVPMALIGLTLSGCKPARMDEGRQLQEQAQDLTVQGRGAFDQDFRFGPYAVTGIRRDWTERTAWGVFGFQDAQARQRFEFRLAGASDWVGHWR